MIKVKVGHPMLPARRVAKFSEMVPFCAGPSGIHYGYARSGWRQICGDAMAHYYLKGESLPLCGTNVTFQTEPKRGVPVPACKLCVRKRGGKL